MTTCGAVMLPRKVLLFSGHMIDAPGRKEMRFPADKEPTAADAIARTLDEIFRTQPKESERKRINGSSWTICLP